MAVNLACLVVFVLKKKKLSISKLVSVICSWQSLQEMLVKIHFMQRRKFFPFLQFRIS